MLLQGERGHNAEWMHSALGGGQHALIGVFLSKAESSRLSGMWSGLGLGGCRKGERTRDSVLCLSLVFLIGSTHMLDSELPKQTRLCVLPKIILLGVSVVPSGNLHLVSLPHCCCFMESLLAFVVFSTWPTQIWSTKYRGNCLRPRGLFFCPGVTLFNLTSNLFLLHVTLQQCSRRKPILSV